MNRFQKRKKLESLFEKYEKDILIEDLESSSDFSYMNGEDKNFADDFLKEILRNRRGLEEYDTHSKNMENIMTLNNMTY